MKLKSYVWPKEKWAKWAEWAEKRFFLGAILRKLIVQKQKFYWFGWNLQTKGKRV